ncbi:hypothetical protein ACN47E_008004 [Coniothyrium glycines]
MPQTIDFEDYDGLERTFQRRHYLINIWRSMPMTTDRIHAISPAELKLALNKFVDMCATVPSVKALLLETYQRCGYPWCKDVNVTTKRGRAWIKTFMYAALKLHGIVGVVEDGSWEPKSLRKFSEEVGASAVRNVIVDEIVDEWLETHDRLFVEARDMVKGLA